MGDINLDIRTDVDNYVTKRYKQINSKFFGSLSIPVNVPESQIIQLHW